MNSYRLSPAAQRDLASIWQHTEDHWSTRQAEIYINEIRAAVERIAEIPERGRMCDEIRAGYHRYGIGRHVLFYVSTVQGVDIIRILHQRMDPSRHL